MKKIFLPIALLPLVLSACGSSGWCAASPFCYNPGGSVGIVSFADVLIVSVKQGETISVPVKLDFGQISVSESLNFTKADAASQKSTDPTLIAVTGGDVEIKAASNPFTVNSASSTTLSFTASPTAQLGKRPTQDIRITRVKIPNAQTAGLGVIAITVLPK
jgi:hypothetical protein